MVWYYSLLHSFLKISTKDSSFSIGLEHTVNKDADKTACWNFGNSFKYFDRANNKFIRIIETPGNIYFSCSRTPNYPMRRMSVRTGFRAWLKLSNPRIHDLKTHFAFRSYCILIQAYVSFVQTEGWYLILLAERSRGNFKNTEIEHKCLFWAKKPSVGGEISGWNDKKSTRHGIAFQKFDLKPSDWSSFPQLWFAGM